ncbi:MAG TPA: class I SAM-dependent rRNA methyltransferase [Terriglobales bacterium]|nr:class I SAM-dependent rRNA methyltransferase [Terriglobales bacterium]
MAPRSTVPASALATVQVSRRGATRVRDGHPWIYQSDLSAHGVAPGALVTVRDERGKVLGTALYSSSSQIALRMLSAELVSDLSELIRKRIADAVQYRKHLVTGSDAYRVIFSEADFLPGLIVDRYNDILTFQVLTQGMDSQEVREALLSGLTGHFHPAGIAERVDARVRELESLPARASGLVQGEKSSTTFTMNDVRFHYDSGEGQKTGAFLDQRENYAAAASYAHGEALDVFCYHGGFALHLAKVCSQVTGVDSSRPALETADQNAALNGHEIEWIEANAFDLLKDYASARRLYDTIVLDPPAFAKGKRNLETALRGYKELNLRALKMLRPGGVLVTCSCSYHVSEAEFLTMLSAACADSRRQARIMEKRGQAKDHPILATVPETAYLKCVILAVTY